MPFCDYVIILFKPLERYRTGTCSGALLLQLWSNAKKWPSDIRGQRRPRSACTSAQSDQGLHCPLTKSLDTTEYINREQRHGWLCACAGLCEFSDFAHARRFFIAVLFWFLSDPSSKQNMSPEYILCFWCYIRSEKKNQIKDKRAKMALYRSPDYQTSFESISLSVQEKKFNIDFQDGGHLGFPIRTFLFLFLMF